MYPKPVKINIAMKEYPPRTGMEVFKSFPEGTRVQLIENMIVMEPAPVYLHQDVLCAIFLSLAGHVQQCGLGKVLVAPVDVYLDGSNAFQPDILFIAKERLCLLRENGLHGAPDMVIEILSPSTAKYDRGNKKRVYERNGVREYWIVDPHTRIVQGYRLLNGAFEALPATEGVLCSRLFRRKFEL